ncbi:MFS transporter [Natrarchaeobaculum sulfurireducens]|uniref:dolichyl-phosphooligosaccharide-protein glycotransferase n=1 Tax=Natrarchaeobaculum sulfurireducens TaxID=2044521 RepID=A0A346PDY3_9EURY|nr:MFS transporter [Natrarchaeobaculum sulfurireducens]AXR77728.1 Dolichol phosphate-mannose mannosyltransferase [Natrarchaeobaculum sulfurireducens]
MDEEQEPETIANAATAFCERYDRGEDILETLLEIDAEYDTWTFDELPLDSGTFGELVSRGIVTKVDDEYHVSSREGIKAALEGITLSSEADSTSRRGFSNPISIDGRKAVALVAALAVMVGMRVLTVRPVLREGHVVSPANDPYHYRYWMEALLAESNGITDVSVIAGMPDGAASMRPLTHAANWFFAELLGGDQWAAEMVAAWLPVVFAVALGVVVYWLAVVVTDDVRVGVAAVLLLALTPAHAVYTSIGFLEHRLHQYFWLGVTMLALAWLAVDLHRRWELESSPRAATDAHLRAPWTWVAAFALGVALPFSAFAWGGSILMFVPVAAYVTVKVAADVRAGFSPARSNAPVVAGLAVGGILSSFLHFGLGWHEVILAIVAVLVVAGAVAVAGLGELWRRFGWRIRALLGLEVGLGVLGIAALRQLRPTDWARLQERAGDLFFRDYAVETASLFRADRGVVFEPLAQLGLNFFVAVAVLGWACWIVYRRYDPGWLVIAVYAAFWLVMATLQGRFAAQLSIPFAVLGGLGLIYVLAWVDLARVPRRFRKQDADTRGRDASSRREAATDGGDREPSIGLPRDRRNLVAIAWILLLFCGISLIYTPSLVAMSAHSDERFEAAIAIDEHATAVDRTYPENFVLSNWGHNRMYNYHVNGKADDYWYADDHYTDFVVDDDPDGWYEEFDESEVGYVVLTSEVSSEEMNEAGVNVEDGDLPADSSQVQLHDELGTGTEDYEPLEHYQAIYVHDDVTAFAVVPGAELTGSVDPNETVQIQTEVTVSDEPIEYDREVRADGDGTFNVTVPYPEEYTVDDADVGVSSEAVETGELIQLE